MSSLPEPTPSPPRAVPLGRLLVERGLLTEEQLIEGLLEQDRTGDRLGKVLIDLGFVDPPTVAMALATQHGGPLKTEYGFATGFDVGGSEPAGPPPSPDPVSSQPFSELRLASAAPETFEYGAADERQAVATLAEPDTIHVELEAAHTRIAELEHELEVAREQLDERRSRNAELADQLAAARVAAETAIAALRRVTEVPA
jgi:hypothetical protein